MLLPWIINTCVAFTPLLLWIMLQWTALPLCHFSPCIYLQDKFLEIELLSQRIFALLILIPPPPTLAHRVVQFGFIPIIYEACLLTTVLDNRMCYKTFGFLLIDRRITVVQWSFLKSHLHYSCWFFCWMASLFLIQSYEKLLLVVCFWGELAEFKKKFKPNLFIFSFMTSWFWVIIRKIFAVPKW